MMITKSFVWLLVIFATLACRAQIASVATTPRALYATYFCPLSGIALIRQGDSVAPSGGCWNSTRGTDEGPHDGLDLNSCYGAPVFAVRTGVVLIARIDWDKKGFGTTVILDHGDGMLTLYGHLGSIFVAEGMTVQGGQPIGTVGYSGNAKALERAGLPSHLHFGMFVTSKSGLVTKDFPLAKIYEVGGPVVPSFFMGNNCWLGDPTACTRYTAPASTKPGASVPLLDKDKAAVSTSAPGYSPKP